MRTWRAVLAAGALALVGMPVQAQQFGAYVATDGDEILVSEPVKPNEPATVYVYRMNGGDLGAIRDHHGPTPRWWGLLRSLRGDGR